MKNRKACTVFASGFSTILYDPRDKSLTEEIVSSVKEGYNHFYTTLGNKVDCDLARIVIYLKQKYDLTLEAVFSRRSEPLFCGEEFKKLLRGCDKLTYTGIFDSKKNAEARIKYILGNSDKCIVVRDEIFSYPERRDILAGYELEVSYVTVESKLHQC